MPVLTCRFFKINYLRTSKTPFFRTVELILIFKSDIIIIIVMNIDMKISFFYLKYLKTRKSDAFLGLPLGLKPFNLNT